MKKYEDKICTIKVVSEMVCDLCGKVSNSNSWSENFHETLETNVEYKNGTSDYGGGEYTKISVDICPDCFKNKLVPFFISNGVKIREEHITF